MTFKPRKTLLAEQHWDEAERPQSKERGNTVDPPHETAFTMVKITCPADDCQNEDEVKSYSGSNCFFECPCGQAIGPV